MRRRSKRKRSIHYDYGQMIAQLKPGFMLSLTCIGLFLLAFLLYEIWVGWRYSIWDGNRFFSTVYESNDQIGYISFNPEIDEIIILSMPEDLMMPLGYGYGEYRVDKIKPLAQLDDVAFGDLLQQSMLQYLGVHSDAYVVGVDSDNVDINVYLLKSLFKMTDTNLSSWDLIRLLNMARNLRVENIKQIQLEDTDILIGQVLPDDTTVLTTDFGKLDNFVLTQFADPDYLSDTNTWEIYNATNNAGFGAWMKRVVANSGFDVVGVRQANELGLTSAIELREESLTQSVRDFSEDSGIPIVFHTDNSRRSSVQVILGDDYWNQCCTRK